jgi:hypothetical protein
MAKKSEITDKWQLCFVQGRVRVGEGLSEGFIEYADSMGTLYLNPAILSERTLLRNMRLGKWRGAQWDKRKGGKP